MSSRILVLIVVALAGVTNLLAGCVYYNGMYNANRLARSARKAERDGRTFEANGLWGQVATKAESVLVRHPTSKYAQDAGLLRGIALSRLGQCEQALGPLSGLTTARSSADLLQEALLASGRCQLAMGNLAAAGAAFSQLLESKNAERRGEARFQQARLLRQAGQYAEALRALEGQHDLRAEHERVLALSGSGRIPEALALSDSLMAHGDTTRSWDSLLVVLADSHPAVASRLVDRVRRLPNRSKNQAEVRMLLEDGFRLAEIDPKRAQDRFRQVLKAGATGEAAGRASLALVKIDLKRVAGPHELQPIADTLKRLAERFELVSDETARLSSTVEEVRRVATVVTQDSALGDLRLFLAAEAAREELKAPRLAEGLFRQIHEKWPLSPYSPKAVLAAQQLNPAWADTARYLLEFQYWDSPYLATVRGDATPEYRQLEDSLSAFAASLVVRKPTPVRRAPPPRVPPRRRPEPVSGGSNVPEPQ
jgi:tetratricopeptide (TPR) repeat protein